MMSSLNDLSFLLFKYCASFELNYNKDGGFKRQQDFTLYNESFQVLPTVLANPLGTSQDCSTETEKE